MTHRINFAINIDPARVEGKRKNYIEEEEVFDIAGPPNFISIVRAILEKHFS